MNRVLAQLKNPVLPPGLGDAGPKGGGIILGNIIGALVGVILTFSFIFALFFLLFGAIEWLTSEGEKTKLESARNKMTHALVGLVLVAASWAVMLLVGQFLGFSFTSSLFSIPVPSVQ